MNTSKHCTLCKQIKHIDDFAKKGASRQSRCKNCFNEYTRSHYKRNKQKYLDKAKRSNFQYSKESGEIIFQKKSVPCADCKQYYHPHAMDFDHLRDKAYNVGRLRTHSKEVLSAEIEKCEVVCATCHRLRTLRRKSMESVYSAHDYMVDYWKNNLTSQIENSNILSVVCKNKALNLIQLISNDALFYGAGLEFNPRGVSDGTELAIFLSPKHIRDLYPSHNAHISLGILDRAFLHFKEPPQNTEVILLQQIDTSLLLDKLNEHMKLAIQLDHQLKRV